jgi:hypothetical protein
MGNLALTYKEQGQLKMAQEIQAAVLEKKKTTLGVEHSETLRAMEDLASTCMALAQINESQEHHVGVVENNFIVNQVAL